MEVMNTQGFNAVAENSTSEPDGLRIHENQLDIAVGKQSTIG